MKINDFIFRYKTDAILIKVGICRVRTFVNMEKKAVYVVLSQLDENLSCSVTNAVESIVDQLVSSSKIPPNAIIIDHYPKSHFFNVDKFSIVTFDADRRPSWSGISFQECLQALNCKKNEFSDYRKNKQVQKELYSAIKGIPKIEMYEYSEDPDITQRRLEIDNNQYTLHDVRSQLEKNPSEAEMAAFIKGDMSLLAEMYAYPKDEYICFSEFPIGEGRADFVVFTGRSRMSVYIIEIKGANIPLRRKGHYGSFRSSVQEGKDQLEERAKYSKENYEKFRCFTYNVLNEVKKGNRPYNTFRGPIYELEVDPNKDIVLTYVLIAGRTSDDLNDSQKRHTVENSSNIHIKIETWDSWLNKLTRK